VRYHHERGPLTSAAAFAVPGKLWALTAALALAPPLVVREALGRIDALTAGPVADAGDRAS
jgi:hypothetical protein